MATSSQNLSAEVLADYHQFYLWDKSVSPDAPEDWTEQDVANRLKVAPNIVVVCPERNTKVPVTVEVRTSEPELQIEECAYSAEDDRPFRSNVTGDSAKSALSSFSTLIGHDQSRF